MKLRTIFISKKLQIILLFNFLLFNVIAHSENTFNIPKEKCQNGEAPLLVLDSNTLIKGHGKHNYVSKCPEDYPSDSKLIKRHEHGHGDRSGKIKVHKDRDRHHFEKEKPEIKSEIFDWSNNSTIALQQVSMKEYLNATETFKIEFHCYVTPNLCEKARLTFEGAAQKIALAIKVTRPIIVEASLYSFCKIKGDAYCSNVSSIGSAAASAYHILNRNGTRYLFPQPLVKQMDEVSVFMASDITADFNSDYSFYFAGDDKIEEGQVDYEFVVLHELIHGLGFATSFQKYFSDVIKVTDSQDFLTPSLALINETYISNWRPIQIFDKNVLSTGTQTSFDNYSNDITGFVASRNNLSALEYHNEFISSIKPYQAAKAVYQSASNQAGSLVFHTSQGKDIILYTKDEFMQGSSIAHLDDKYIKSPDFIMISDVSPFQGRTLASLYKEYGENHPYGAIGPNVLSILSEIGWEIAEEPANITTFYTDSVSSAYKQSTIKSYIQSLIIISFIYQLVSILF